MKTRGWRRFQFHSPAILSSILLLGTTLLAAGTKSYQKAFIPCKFASFRLYIMSMKRIKDLTSEALDKMFGEATEAARIEAKEEGLPITGTNERGSIVTVMDSAYVPKKKGRRVA